MQAFAGVFAYRNVVAIGNNFAVTERFHRWPASGHQALASNG